LVHE